MSRPASVRRRLAIRVAIAIVVAVVLDLLIAWGCAYALDDEQGSFRNSISVEDGRWCEIVRISRLGMDRIVWGSGRVDPDRDPATDPPPGEPPEDITPTWLEIDRSLERRAEVAVATGVPFRSWRGQGRLTKQGYEIDEGWLANPRGTTFGRIIPTAPIWRGQIANVALFAALLSAALILPGAVRRRRRAARGCCAHCGYALGESTTCPECGAQR